MLRPPTEPGGCRSECDMVHFIISFSNIENSVTKPSREHVARKLHFLAKGKHTEINYLGHETLMVFPKENTV